MGERGPNPAHVQRVRENVHILAGASAHRRRRLAKRHMEGMPHSLYTAPPTGPLLKQTAEP